MQGGRWHRGLALSAVLEHSSGADAELSGAIEARSSRQLRSHVQLSTITKTWQHGPQTARQQPEVAAPLSLRVPCGRTVSAAGGHGRAAPPVA